ncbi:MAG: hypothetical protein QM703_14990 [Gemmatales bacterium]
MKRKLWWNGILAVLLGSLAGWLSQALWPCVILQQSDTFTCYQTKGSANGRYLVGLVSADKNDLPDHLQLWDIESGVSLGRFPEQRIERDALKAWGCGDDGSILTVQSRLVEERNEKGKVSPKYIYSFHRKYRDEQQAKLICTWTLPGSDRIPPYHQFAFSRDGAILAHAVNEDGKLWIESIDTTTGELLNTLPIENAYFLMSLREYPRRSGFLAITHPQVKNPPGFDTSKSSLLVLDGSLRNIELRRDYPDYPFEYSFITEDGEHLYLTSSVGIQSPLLDLKTGERVSLPGEMVEKLKDEIPVRHYFLWPEVFGKGLMMLSDIKLTADKMFLIDWHKGTTRQTKYVMDPPFTFTSPQLLYWLPGSSSLLIHRMSKTHPNQIHRWYYEFLKWMKWGAPNEGYQELALFDVNTLQTTTWHALGRSWNNIGVCSAIDGKRLLIILNNAWGGMQVELWDNPMMPPVIPRGVLPGVGVGLISFLLLMGLSRWRAARVKRKVS